MAFTFVSGIGDILAITKLVAQVYESIRNIATLKQQVDEFCTRYMSLLHIVNTLHVTEQQDATVPVHLRNALIFHLSGMKTSLEAFAADSHMVIDATPRRSAIALMSSAARRVQHSLMQETLFRRLNEDFEHHLEAFKLYAAAVSSHRQQYAIKAIDRTVDDVSLISCNLQVLVRMLGSMPKELGYTWEGGELRQQISFVHASGEQQFVPQELCRSFETFYHGFLGSQKDYPGAHRVNKGHFQLLDLRSGLIIDHENAEAWRGAVCPGARLALSIIVGTWLYRRSLNVHCVRCASPDIVDDVYSGWKSCTNCSLTFKQLAIGDYKLKTEPIDVCDWDLDAQFERDESTFGSHDPSGRPDPDPALKNQQKPAKISVHPSINDREDRLRRVTMVFSPIWNFVYRAAICHCRLSSASSLTPFCPSFDITIWQPCRLHYFDEMAEHGINLTRPEPGYDPALDPYFDKFGGHAAFAAYIAIDPIVERSLNVRKLLPHGTVDAAAAALGRAMCNEEQRSALEGWETEFHESYFKWRSQHGEKNARWKAEVRASRQPPPIRRRGSFS